AISPNRRRGWPDQVRPRGSSLAADRDLATAFDPRTALPRAVRARDILPDACSDHLVGRQGQEFGEGRGFDQLAEEPGRVVVTAAVPGSVAQFREFLVEEFPAECGDDDAA